MKECNFLQTYEIFLKLIYLKLLQEYLNNEVIGFTDKLGEEESVYYTVTDIQGSITEVYDGSSNLVWKSGYTAFGELAGETVDLIDFDGMYTGCDYDSETGLTYHWNRWRSEDGSCFISEDPARDGANWYGYCNNNPLTYTDPLGLYPYNNLNEAMEDYYTNYATDADRKQMHFFGLIDQASMGNKSAQNTLKFAFHQANQEMLQDISNVTGDASLAFLAIGCPEAAGALGTVSIVADILSAVDNYVNGEYGIANKQILLITGSMIASKSVENVARKIARVEIHIGKTSRYYEIGKRGAIKSEKALKKIIAKDIASGYFGENIAPEMASQIIKESVDAYKSITKQGENEKRNEKKNNNKDK